MTSIPRTETSDKVQRYAMHKKLCGPVASLLDKINEHGRALRMRECATRLLVRRCTGCGEMHITGGNLCRDRLCPVCQWRLSIRRYSNMVAAMNHLHDQGKLDSYQVGMLTLTVKNCPPADLGATISGMMDGFKRWQQRRTVRDQIAGFARSLEITYNRKRGTFHPHIHLMIIWQPAGKSGKLSAQMAKEWASACRLNYKPVYQYEDAYSKHQNDGSWDTVLSTVKECSKYVCKAADYITIADMEQDTPSMPITHFRALVDAVKNRRLVSYAGLIAEARRDLLIPDDEETEENATETDVISCPKCGSSMGESLLEWAGVGASAHYVPAAATYSL